MTSDIQDLTDEMFHAQGRLECLLVSGTKVLSLLVGRVGYENRVAPISDIKILSQMKQICDAS